MAKKKIYRSGVIPYYVEEGNIYMLFMKPSDPKYGGSNFQIGKGKLEEGEDPKEAGLREAGEELGLFKGNIEQVTKVGQFMGRTHVFIAKIKDKDLFGKPHFETEETKWLTLDEFLKEGRELHKLVIKAAARLITKKENLEVKNYDTNNGR